MKTILAHFVDRAIPGLSGRDLVRHDADRVSGRHRRDLRQLNLAILRDIGLDRSAI